MNSPRRPIDDEVARDDELVGRNGRSPDQGANAREELVVRVRVTDNVVGAALERSHALDGVRSCGEHDDWNVPVPRPPGLAAPKPQAEVELGEQDDGGTRGLRELERLAAPSGTEDVEAVLAKLPAEEFARLGLRLGDSGAGEIFAVIGDGTWLMGSAELATAVGAGLKVTVVLLVNGGYQSIHGLQRAAGGPSFGNEFRDPDGIALELIAGA